MEYADLAITLLVVSAVVTTALAVFASRYRREPGASAFVLLMLSLTVWSGGYAVALRTFHPDWRLFWEGIQWFGTTLHLWLFLFALAYTGYDQYVTRKSVALLLVFPTLSILTFWTNQWHYLMWTKAGIVVVEGLSMVEYTYGPAFWVHTAYTYSLIFVAAALLVRLIFVSDYLYADQSALLSVGIAVPFVTNVVDIVFLEPGPAVDLTPIAFTVTGVAFGYALFRRRLFDLVPATRQLGRNAAIGQLDTGVVIVDNAQRIVYANEAAGDVFDCAPADALGRKTRSFVDDSEIDFDAEDALAELERGDRIYEIRTTAVTDRRGRRIGHTLVIHDVTARKRRERELAAQRDELATVNDLNAVIRGVNQALVSATSREEIERAVCELVVEADLYRTACIADVATWTGDADRWYVASDHDDPSPPALDDGDLDTDDLDVATGDAAGPLVPEAPTDGGTWVVVPVVYGRTVYGALGLYTDREDVSDRERVVLSELGETVGHAINATETRRLLSADAVVELELESTDEADPLAVASREVGCTLELAGLVPSSDDGHLAYVRVADVAAERARESLADAAFGAVRAVRDGDADGLLEWQVTGDALLGSLTEYGANVQSASADEGRTRYELEVASDANVRTLVDDVERRFPDVVVVAKRERAGPIEEPEAIEGETLANLTDRQREVIEAAYRAGYFNWPRDSTAEEVADSLDISSATLHSHLRKAESSLLTDIFDRPDAGGVTRRTE